MIYKQIRGVISEVVAVLLTGRPCEVEYRPPYLAGARGMAARDGFRGVIHIDPDLEPEQMLKTFLHELAHIALDFDKLARNGDHKQDPGAVALAAIPSGKRLPAEHELAAEEWAAKWYDLTVQIEPSSDYNRRLLALARVLCAVR